MGGVSDPHLGVRELTSSTDPKKKFFFEDLGKLFYKKYHLMCFDACFFNILNNSVVDQFLYNWHSSAEIRMYAYIWVRSRGLFKHL